MVQPLRLEPLKIIAASFAKMFYVKWGKDFCDASEKRQEAKFKM